MKSTKQKHRKEYKESMTQRAVSLKKINKFDKPLYKLIKRWREITQIYKIRNEKKDLTIDTEEIQRIIRSYDKTCTTQYWKM